MFPYQTSFHFDYLPIIRLHFILILFKFNLDIYLFICQTVGKGSDYFVCYFDTMYKDFVFVFTIQHNWFDMNLLEEVS